METIQFNASNNKKGVFFDTAGSKQEINTDILKIKKNEQIKYNIFLLIVSWLFSYFYK